jgi:hypothetical protein
LSKDENESEFSFVSSGGRKIFPKCEEIMSEVYQNSHNIGK